MKGPVARTCKDGAFRKLKQSSLERTAISANFSFPFTQENHVSTAGDGWVAEVEANPVPDSDSGWGEDLGLGRKSEGRAERGNKTSLALQGVGVATTGLEPVTSRSEVWRLR